MGDMSERRVEREAVLPADTDEAWRALSDPELLSEWLGGEVDVELRPGGDLSVEFSDGERRDGFVEEVAEGRRLVFWWSADGDEEASRVEIELEPDGDGTVIRVVETLPISTVLSSPLFAPEAPGGSGPQMSSALTAVG